MVGYRVMNGEKTGVYGFEDDCEEANKLLKICQRHDPKASIEKYKYESQSEEIARLKKELSEISAEYLEICGNDCAGDESTGIGKCRFYDEPDIYFDGTPFIGGCRLRSKGA